MASNGAGMKSRSDEEVLMMLENIEEWVEDEGRLLTYKWLSRTLGLHVNEAKDLLAAYVSRLKPVTNDASEPPPALTQSDHPPPSGFGHDSQQSLTVTYCLTGTVKQNGSDVFRLRLVRGEEDRHKAEAEFLSPVSCHVYGVQRRTTLADPHLLYGTDFDMTKKNVLSANEFSGVTCAWAKLRTPEEMVPVRVEATTEQQLIESSSKEAVKSKDVTGSKSKSSVPTKTTAASFFGNNKPKSATNMKIAESLSEPQAMETAAPSHPQKAQSKPVAPSRNGGITSLFKAAPTKPPTAEGVASEASKTGAAKVAPEMKSDVKQKGGLTAKDTRAACVPSAKANVEDCADDAPSKKRRRVVALISSSEDEEEEENMDIEDSEPLVISTPPSAEHPSKTDAAGESVTAKWIGDAASSVKLPSGNLPTVHSAGAQQAAAASYQMNRKLVSKTFLNAEGFIVTEKVWETQTTLVDAATSDPVEADPAGGAGAVVEPGAPVKQNGVKAAGSGEEGKGGKSQGAAKAQSKKGPTKAAAVGKQQSMMTFFKKQ